MADLDTRLKRSSAVGVLAPWMMGLPGPDGTVGPGDRQHVAWTYSGLLALAPAVAAVAIGVYARVLVGDWTGRVLAELEPELESVAWRLNEVGKATFALARTDPKATADNLRFGNRVLIEFSNGLPNWGGVIDTPRGWTKEGRIEVTAYSAEYVLGWRRTGKSRGFSGTTVGTVFQTLIVEANGERDTGIGIGSIYAGGDAVSIEFHDEIVLEIVQRQLLAHRLSTYDFAITAEEAGGRIVFTAHFYDRRGATRGNVALLESVNAVDPDLLEQGPIVNDWAVAGAGSTWGEERAHGVAQNAASIAAYDLRQGAESQTSLESSAACTIVAGNLVAQSAQPRNRLSLGALDVAPGRFADYDVGDRIRAILPSYGFGGYDQSVRVITREYEPRRGVCGLVVEEDHG